MTAERRPGEHREYLPSLHTLYQHIYAGGAAPVSFDGRRYGAPLNKQLGPSVWAGPFAPTAVLASAARLPIAQLPGGQALDIAIPHEMLATPAGRQQFRALVETYFRLGGADLQVNTADPADLRAAQAHPEEYGHLVVRVAGYSEFFTKLDRAQQDDLIERIAAGV
ncbi:MAG: glycine radical domain-containing protein [Armatimonadota bacterium]